MSKVPPWMFEWLWLHFWPDLMRVLFPTSWVEKQFWRHQICKHYQNITCRLVFMIVFGIHCNFFIVSPIQLKICRSNIFFTRQEVRARKIGRVSEVLRAWACPIGNGHAKFVQSCKCICDHFEMHSRWSAWNYSDD